jgi:L,D-peptidoglycan transpeptidase YkuD (ErfK/YbiS/YcfS/YnhG family)
MLAVLTVDTQARRLHAGDQTFPCAIGRGGTLAAADKREGDGCTPLGRYPLRSLYARPDRMASLITRLPLHWLTPQHGWCDEPAHPDYNRPVMLPFAGNHERMWREDGLYDLIVTLGHNDAPPVPGMGSAIFLHCCAYAADGMMKPTLGCIAIAQEALVSLVARLGPDMMIEIG